MTCMLGVVRCGTIWLVSMKTDGVHDIRVFVFFLFFFFYFQFIARRPRSDDPKMQPIELPLTTHQTKKELKMEDKPKIKRKLYGHKNCSSKVL